MPTYSARRYLGPSDLPLLIDFARRTSAARAPSPAYYHPGDFVWQLYQFDASDDVRVWLDGEHVVAVAIFEPPLTFGFEIDPTVSEQGGLTDEILSSAEGRRAGSLEGEPIPIAYDMFGIDTIATTALESDARRIAALTDAGYARSDRHSIRFARALDDAIAEPELPAGATVRSVAEDEIAERAELHRDAWSVWGRSSFSEDAYRRLRMAPLYDAELDIFVELQGRFISYCVCWADDMSGTGYFEPVGTRPSAAGRGFGRAVILEGLRRMRARGLHTALVQTASVNAAAEALYRSCGFAVVEREWFWVKGM